MDSAEDTDVSNQRSSQRSDPINDGGDSSQRPRRWDDVAAFMAVIFSGGALVIFGHQSPTQLAGYGATVSSLYLIWRNNRR